MVAYFEDKGWAGANGVFYSNAESASVSLYGWSQPAPAHPEPDTPRKLRVFMCHAKEDKETIRILYDKLRICGLEPWLDEKDLLPGQEWQVEISQAIERSDAILICFSRMSVSKTGHVQKEMRLALERADEQPQGKIFLIPMRIEECDVPQRFREIHRVDYFHPDGYEKLVLAFQHLAKWLEKANHDIQSPEMNSVNDTICVDNIEDVHSNLYDTSKELLRLLQPSESNTFSQLDGLGAYVKSIVMQQLVPQKMVEIVNVDSKGGTEGINLRLTDYGKKVRGYILRNER